MYQVQNPIQSALAGMNQAAGSYGGMMKNIPAHGAPGHTAGGAIMGGMGGALAGGQIGTMVGESITAAALAEGMTATQAMGMGASAGPWGIAIGAALGIGSYLMS